MYFAANHIFWVEMGNGPKYVNVDVLVGHEYDSNGGDYADDLDGEDDADVADEQDQTPASSVETAARQPVAFLLGLRPLDCELFYLIVSFLLD